MSNFQALNKNQHQALKIIPDNSYAHSKNAHITPISVFEVVNAQAEYPIAFIKDAETGRLHLVALLGLKPEQNLFYHPNGWLAHYIPQQLRNYPFAITNNSAAADNSHAVLALNIDSSLVNDKNGEPLFTDSGEQSEFLQKKAELLSQTMAQVATTQDFIEHLTNIHLLSPQSLTIKPENEPEFNLTGLYVIDEKKLNDLSDDDYQSLKQKGYISAIYACLFSMHRISNLVNKAPN